MAEKGNKLVNTVIPWLTEWIWRDVHYGKAKCRGCGCAIPKGAAVYKYIYGFYEGMAQRGYLCQECGQTALQTIIERASGLLHEPIEATRREQVIQAAVDEYAYEDLEVGPNVRVCASERGYWVSAWVWVPNEEA